MKVAVTVLTAFMVIVQEPAPVQSPDQPVKEELALGVAVKVTVVPFEYCSVQSAPQLIPTGSLDTVPVPVPDLVTVSSCFPA